METHMSSELYKAAIAGDVLYLQSDMDIVSGKRSGLLSLTHEQNNCLHIAARFGHEKFVQRVLSLCPPSLLYHQNKRGDNPLHVAARAGHLRVVKLLTKSFQRHQPPQSTERAGNRATTEDGIPSERSLLREAKERESTIQNLESSTTLTDSVQPPSTSQSRSNGNSATAGDIVIEITPEWPSLPIWRTQNNEGSTALHEALRSKHKDVALHLLDLEILDSKLLTVLVINAKDETPLYLAAEAGFDLVLTKILQILRASGHLIKTVVDERHGNADNVVPAEKNITIVGPKDQTPLHAAVFSESAGSIKVLHDSIPGLIRKQDSHGKTALYYATQANSLKIMRLLLKLDSSSTYICDNEGLSPLLLAASVGFPESVRAILDACPASIECCDNGGGNALHLAEKNNTTLRFRNLLRMPEMMNLINEPDKEGNTPLHLAARDHNFQKAKALLSAKRVDLGAKNNLGQTVLDVSVLDAPVFFYGEQRNLWVKLKRKNAPTGRDRPLMRLRNGDPSNISTKYVNTKDLNLLINTMSVVAALLATITFAAPFQMPGGYASLIHKPALIVFLLSDTLALVYSMSALLLFVFGTLNQKAVLQAIIGKGVKLIFAALSTAMFAFISGLYVVTSVESTWVAMLICIIGFRFFLLHYWKGVGLALVDIPFLPGLVSKEADNEHTEDPLTDEQASGKRE